MTPSTHSHNINTDTSVDGSSELPLNLKATATGTANTFPNIDVRPPHYQAVAFVLAARPIWCRINRAIITSPPFYVHLLLLSPNVTSMVWLNIRDELPSGHCRNIFFGGFYSLTFKGRNIWKRQSPEYPAEHVGCGHWFPLRPWQTLTPYILIATVKEGFRFFDNQ